MTLLTKEEVEKCWRDAVGQYGHVAGLYKDKIAENIERKVIEKIKAGGEHWLWTSDGQIPLYRLPEELK